MVQDEPIRDVKMRGKQAKRGGLICIHEARIFGHTEGHEAALSQHSASETTMTQKPDRDIEKDYPLPDFIDKLRRLANALENGQRFEIQIAGERVSVPVRATYNIEHERGDGEEEIEFQIKWSSKS